MKEIRCSFTGHFYIQVKDNASFDEIEQHLSEYIDELEECIDPHAALDEYDWSEENV